MPRGARVSPRRRLTFILSSSLLGLFSARRRSLLRPLPRFRPPSGFLIQDEWARVESGVEREPGLFPAEGIRKDFSRSVADSLSVETCQQGHTFQPPAEPNFLPYFHTHRSSPLSPGTLLPRFNAIQWNSMCI